MSTQILVKVNVTRLLRTQSSQALNIPRIKILLAFTDTVQIFEHCNNEKKSLYSLIDLS